MSEFATKEGSSSDKKAIDTTDGREINRYTYVDCRVLCPFVAARDKRTGIYDSFYDGDFVLFWYAVCQKERRSAVAKEGMLCSFLCCRIKKRYTGKARPQAEEKPHPDRCLDGVLIAGEAKE